MNDLVITEEASLSFVLQTTDILKKYFLAIKIGFAKDMHLTKLKTMNLSTGFHPSK